MRSTKDTTQTWKDETEKHARMAYRRIIKFRAWHTEFKRMFSAEEMGTDQLTLMPDGRGFVNVHGGDGALSGFAGDKMIPMQFTGLHDLRGIEIYEGDIVKDRHMISAGETCEVYYAPPSFRVRGIGGSFALNEHRPDGYEVIGNIYDTPERLIWKFECKHNFVDEHSAFHRGACGQRCTKCNFFINNLE